MAHKRTRFVEEINLRIQRTIKNIKQNKVKCRRRRARERFLQLFMIMILWSPGEARKHICYTNTRLDLQSGDRCPPGFEVCDGEQQRECQICDDMFYQPYINDDTRLCIAKSRCDGSHLTLLHNGSNTEDTTCGCLKGFHSPAGLLLGCRENSKCPPGYGQSPLGNGKCVECQAGTYSSLNDHIQMCLSVTVCSDYGQCTLEKSTPYSDTKCSPTLKGLTRCKELYAGNTIVGSASTTISPDISTESLRNDITQDKWFIIIIVAVVAAVVTIPVITIFCCRRKKKRKNKERNKTVRHENTVGKYGLQRRAPEESTDEYELLYTSLVEASKSVCMIGTTGTGFRVGDKYIMTNYHVVEALCKDAFTGQRNVNQLSAVCVDFDFRDPSSQLPPGVKHPFDKNNPIVWENKQLDVAILQLETYGDLRHSVPELDKFSNVDQSVTQIYLVGHPAMKPKIFDTHCKIVHLTEEQVENLYKWSLSTFNYNGYKTEEASIEDSRRVLYHVSSGTGQGSSGSPGFMAADGYEAVLVVMHCFAFPDFQKMTDDPTVMAQAYNKTVEQGVKMFDIYQTMKSENPELCKNIFKRCD